MGPLPWAAQFQIKHDVEVQAEFVKSLAREVKQVALTDIEDVVDFVKWLDDELAFLVRALSRHCLSWPWCQPPVSLLSTVRSQRDDATVIGVPSVSGDSTASP